MSKNARSKLNKTNPPLRVGSVMDSMTQRDLSAASKTIKTKAQGQKQKPKPRKEASETRRGARTERKAKATKVHPALERLTMMLAAPRLHRGLPCPINRNVVPSNIVLSTTVTTTRLNWIVAAGKTCQIVIFPGRNKAGTGTMTFDNYAATAQPECSTMDETAIHSRLLALTNAGSAGGQVETYTVSPIPQWLITNVAGVEGSTAPKNLIAYASESNVSAGLAVGEGTCLTWVAGRNYGFHPLSPDVPVGLSAMSHGHIRTKLTGCDIRVTNTTPMANRGGNIVAVQPVNKFFSVGAPGTGAFSQAQLEIYPTFRVYTDAMYTSWKPRPDDLSFGHPAVSEAPGATAAAFLNQNAYLYSDNAAIYVFLNNTTSINQEYQFSIVQNYDFAGQGVTQLGSEIEHAPQLVPIVDSAIAHAASNSGSIGHSMAEAVKSATATITGEAAAGANEVASFLKSKVSAAIKTASGFALAA